MIKSAAIIVTTIVLYGALRSYSVDLQTANQFGRPCTIKQKIVDTVISRNCSVFLNE